jgi:hypothetical protein
MKRTKYNSVKTNGYASKRESRRADVLRLMEKNGYISNLREQVVYELLPAQYVTGFNGKQMCGRRETKYIADFVYIEKGRIIVEDAKGFKTAEYKRKKRLMLKIHGIEIKET